MVNKVILIGNLGKDPEISYTQSGTAVCKVSLATTEKWTNREGEKQEKTEWHNLVFWRRQAEVANEYLRKGSKIFVEGRIQYRQWEGNDGNKRYATDIEVKSFQFLSGRGEGGGGGQRSQQSSDSQPAQSSKGSGAPSQNKSEPDGGGGYHYEDLPPQQQSQGDSFGKNDDDLPF
ncbi:MAG: single-stranded DNA-binding protein [Candidatus Electryonea clarkiae]|nr:single-stranded DNA-binding protein [Candidatus Electryonea clarkiae]MDP8285676.1 single-stranded DNA-binding protein [Candidatus Electryonea clarkiae]